MYWLGEQKAGDKKWGTKRSTGDGKLLVDKVFPSLSLNRLSVTDSRLTYRFCRCYQAFGESTMWACRWKSIPTAMDGIV
jgi:hypothetical protein